MVRRRKSIPGKIRRRIVNRPEEALQLALAEFLDTCLLPPAVWWATPNQKGTRSTYEQEMLRRMGVKRGIPDTWILYRGVLFGPELKRPPEMLKSGKVSHAKPRLSDSQKEMHPRLRDAGAIVGVYQSVEAVERELRNLGFPLRGSSMVLT